MLVLAVMLNFCYIINAYSYTNGGKILFDHLLSPYNKLARPIRNVNDTIRVQFKLKLLQVVEVVRKRYIISDINRYFLVNILS